METLAPGVKALTVAAGRAAPGVSRRESTLVPRQPPWSAGPMELSILYEDNHLLAVDKPAGLLSQSAEAGDEHLVAIAQRYLKERYGKPGNVYVGLVHRLDRMTSGVMVLAKTSKASERLSRAFREHRVDKRYLAVVAGLTPSRATLVDELVSNEQGSRVATGHPDARRAELSFERCAQTGAPIPASLLEVELGTGRKHQIRVQLAARGHPLIGDRRYGLREHDPLIARVALHAWKIALTHPVRGDELSFVAPIPKDFSSLMARLGLALKPADA